MSLIQYGWCYKTGEVTAETDRHREDNVRRRRGKAVASQPRRQVWSPTFSHGPRREAALPMSGASSRQSCENAFPLLTPPSLASGHGRSSERILSTLLLIIP